MGTTMKPRVVVSDEFGSHGDSMVAGVIWAYNFLDLNKYEKIDITDQVIKVPGWQASLDYAAEHEEVELMLRSTTQLSKYTLDEVKPIYPRVQMLYPMGSNNFIQLNKFTDPEPPIISIIGAGDNEGRNNTAWGNGLEFWDCDYDWNQPGTDYSSFSNAVIAAKFLRTRDELKKKMNRDVTWWEVRYILRETSYKNEPNRETWPWDIHNGYGAPSIDWAVLRGPAINVPADPYLEQIKLGKIGELKATTAGVVNLTLESVDNAEMYILNRNGEYLTKFNPKEKLEYSDILTKYGKYKYEYYATDVDEQTVLSEEILVVYQAGNKPRIVTDRSKHANVVAE